VSHDALLTVNDLHVSYGKVEAVTGVSLEMQAGQIVTVIGPNGAGKTTLLAALMGLLPSKGESRYEQTDIARSAPRSACGAASAWCRSGASCSPR
jgi:ABC-type branched-subunit amino acid transport system ATPase component